jgi:hypothetical protein
VGGWEWGKLGPTVAGGKRRAGAGSGSP